MFYLFWSICHEAKQPFHCLPAVLVCFRGSSVRTGSVALEGRPTPALLTAQTLNWYRLPSFSPNTGKWHIFWRCTLQRSHSPWLTSHLRKSWQKKVGNNKSNLLRRQRKTFIFGAPYVRSAGCNHGKASQHVHVRSKLVKTPLRAIIAPRQYLNI